MSEVLYLIHANDNLQLYLCTLFLQPVVCSCSPAYIYLPALNINRANSIVLKNINACFVCVKVLKTYKITKNYTTLFTFQLEVEHRMSTVFFLNF